MSLGKEPGETTDLAETEPKKLADLAARLQDIHDEVTADMQVWPDHTSPDKTP